MNTKFSPGQSVFYVHNNRITMTRVHSIKITVNNIYYHMTNDPTKGVEEQDVFATQTECREAIKCISL